MSKTNNKRKPIYLLDASMETGQHPAQDEGGDQAFRGR
jgi:hypothetical protein